MSEIRFHERLQISTVSGALVALCALGWFGASAFASDSDGVPVIEATHRVSFPDGPVVSSAEYVGGGELVAAVDVDAVDLTGLVVFGLGCVSAVVGLVLLALVLRRASERLRMARDTPHCSACGYELTHLVAWSSVAGASSASVCPECGARLDRRGSVIAGGRIGGRDVVFVSISGVLVCLAMLVFAFSDSLVRAVPGGGIFSTGLHEWAEAQSPGRVSDFLRSRGITLSTLYRFDVETGASVRLGTVLNTDRSPISVSNDGRNAYVVDGDRLLSVGVRGGGVRTVMRAPADAILENVPGELSAHLVTFGDGASLVALSVRAAAGQPGAGVTRVVEVRGGQIVRTVAEVPYAVVVINRSTFQSRPAPRGWYWSAGGGERGTLVAVSGSLESRGKGEHRVFAFDVATGDAIGALTLEDLDHGMDRHELSSCGEWLYSSSGGPMLASLVRTNLRSGVREIVATAARHPGYAMDMSSSDAVDLLVGFSDSGELRAAGTADLLARLRLPSELYGATNVRVSPDGSSALMIMRGGGQRTGGVHTVPGPVSTELLVFELPEGLGGP